MSRLLRALTENRAETDAGHRDPRLRGRVYDIPFRDVWATALGLVEGEFGRWTLMAADETEGRIQAEAHTRLFSFTDDVEIRVGLDDSGRTRVDLVSESRVGKADLGTNARRIARFLRALDHALDGE